MRHPDRDEGSPRETLLVAVTLDADCEGIANSIDLDDDNDGVPDIAECSAATPYKVYTFNRTNDGNVSPNVPVSIVGLGTINTTINQTVAVTSDPAFPGWKEIATGVYPDASQIIAVSFRPTASTTGSYVLADGMMITNGINTYTLDNSSAAGWVIVTS